MRLEQNTMALEVSDKQFGETLRKLCLSMDPRQAVVDSFAAMLPAIRARLYCFESTGRSGHWFLSKNVAGHGSESILTDATLQALQSRVGQGPRVVSFDGLERPRDEIAALSRLCANARLREATYIAMVIPGNVTCWLSLDGDDRASFSGACDLLERSAKQIQHCLSSQAAFAASRNDHWQPSHAGGAVSRHGGFVAAVLPVAAAKLPGRPPRDASTKTVRNHLLPLIFVYLIQ